MTDRQPAASEPPRLRRIATDELDPAETAAIRTMLIMAFGDDPEERFTDDDWAHTVGGSHFVLDIEGEIVAHAAVVEREIRVDGRALRTGYVEAVTTAPDRQGSGLGTIVMTAVGEHIREHFQLGVLGTGSQHFYERLGWRTWRGPSSVRWPDGLRATPDDDGYLMVLEAPSTPPLDLDAPIDCDWRPGDSW
ncbi:MAG: aminoglycoside 2-N-acetyltransferase [Chloroflexota bacterium]|nr:aminoglycoside 2-N-acetyltransferase [Chloroflexota bacterium]